MRLRSMYGSVAALAAVAALVVAVVWGATTALRGPLDGEWQLDRLVLDGEPVEVVLFGGSTGVEGPPVLRLERGTWLAAACNTAEGTFTLDDGRLDLGAVSSTELGCGDDPETTLDEAWFAALDRVASGMLTSGGELLLLGPETRLLLTRAPGTP